MAPTEADTATTWSITLPNEAATVALARAIAVVAQSDDFVTLAGDLGAGKTTFARALIRELVGDAALEVPSPTFTLMQIYERDGFPVVHADLYRVRSEDELAELGWDEAANGALVLAEWPDRIRDRLPASRLDITFRLLPDQSQDHRSVVLTGRGTFATRLARIKTLGGLLRQAGFGEATRTFMTGDASTRAYEHLKRADGATAVLMISPPRMDGPAGRLGKPYHHVAQLAGDIRPYLAMDAALRQQGVSAPAILAADARAGLAVIEDLGQEPVVQDDAPMVERYLEAVALLAGLHDRSLPDVVSGDGGQPYVIPPYDLEAYLVEVDLLLDWYAPHVVNTALPKEARSKFTTLWQRLLEPVLAESKTWCLRDFHSPNLIWLGERSGTARVGVIDFQDTVMGHPAYDVASLLQDARVTIPETVELRLLGAYAQHRRSENALFDMPTFAENYSILGAQRATKILGIFARLDKRDRKPQYLKLLPRIEAYLAKGLAHPALTELRGWYRAHLPGVLEGKR